MGMTDKQFDAYTDKQLQILEMIKNKLASQGVTDPDLDRFIQSLQDQLKRP